ncbi:MAG: ABC transporter permease [Trueperaceae bacterium]|nr:ABC transporter permease [Trueperaceae bacterium]
MIAFLLRRTGFLALTVLLASMLVFAVTNLLPGDPARILLGREAGPAALAQVRSDLGLDRSVPVRYATWLAGAARGDWGTSFATGEPIGPLLGERLGNSLRLAGVTLAFAVPLAIGLGVLAAVQAGRWPDAVVSLSSLAVVGLPEFVTGIVLIQVFAFGLGWFPANASIPPDTPFLEALPSLVLPAATATLVMLAYVARLTRASVLEELRRPYLRTALLKGVPRRTVLRRHALRNALLPTITVVAISVGWLISGLIVVENVFNYPGLGRLLTFAIDRRDLPLLQAVTLVAVVVFALANLVADVLYAWLDPRIRLA